MSHSNSRIGLPLSTTKRGRPVVIVLSKKDYDRLQQQREPLTSFFARGLEGVEIERIEGAMRDDGEL